MSFYSYKNSGSTHCPCNVSGSDVLSGLNEKICIQVQRVYDSCLMQEQKKEQKVTLLSYGLVLRRAARGMHQYAAQHAHHV